MCTFGIRAYNMAKQSQQEKWKGVFGRLKNCKRYKKGFSVKASNGSLESTCEFMKDVEIGNVSSREIRAWGDSFERLMSSDSGRKVFRAFLRCEYSEENILFWLACEDLKNEPSPELIEEKARIIYEDYVSILSPREQTFNEAQLQIYTLMHRDSYPRFVNSSTYRDLLKTCGSNPNDENEDGKSIHNASELSSR
ncbi:regulator of G-protein signaling 19 isoform X2 [Lepeophtheirus salmonis]|uniref:regulator of G-protein signaling 19 isoform X2 n=1 Tax=Lepeophtheirus salmonis TaxID=72036 RepID=UPI001AE9F0BF|nr:regulator of G-protein signaling 19-like isoform X2 [Lepeophtheirus salmonis]